MRNPFTRLVWLVVFVLALLAFGLARMTKAAFLDGAAVSDGVTEAAPANEVAGAASPGGAGVASGEERVVRGDPSGPRGGLSQTGTVPTSIANPAPMEAFLALLIPLAIAWLKSAVKLPDQYRKWIPVFAPLFGELVTTLATSLPHGSGLVAGLAAVGVREIKDQHSNSGEGTGASGASKGGSPNGIVTGLGMAFVLAVGLLLFCGGLAGCARLDPKGIYHGDKVAYDVDATIDGAYAALDSFVQWHRANAVIVDAKWPEIGAFARQLEDGEGDQWVDDALDLRDAYTKNPSAENRTALDRAVAVLTTALAKAAVYQARLLPGAGTVAKPASAIQREEVPPLARMAAERDGTNYLGVYMGMIAERAGSLRKWDSQKSCFCGEEMPPSVQMFSATSGQLLRSIPFDEFRAVYVDRTRPEYSN